MTDVPTSNQLREHFNRVQRDYETLSAADRQTGEIGQATVAVYDAITHLGILIDIDALHKRVANLKQQIERCETQLRILESTDDV